MAKLNDDRFDVFADPTPPRSEAADGEETTAETPARKGRRPRQGTRPHALRSAETAAPERSIDPDERRYWLTRLGQSGGKLGSAQQRLSVATRQWARDVSDARRDQVPEDVIALAALNAGVEVPEPE